MGKAYANLRYYFEREETPAEWIGRGLESVGIDPNSPVDLARFDGLRRGVAPDGMRLRGDGRESLKPRGTDWVFAPPKSVSIVALVHGDEGVREAHREAVAEAVKVVEEAVTAWARAEGETVLERTGIGLGATFEHEASRANDPQLHTHVVLVNSTLRADGEWRAVDERPQYQVQRLAHTVYLRTLAHGLEERGWALDYRADGGRTPFEIQGVSQEEIRAFSSRREAILEAVGERDALDTSTKRGAVVRALAAIATRDAKRQLDPQERRQRWAEIRAGLDAPSELSELRKVSRTERESPDEPRGVGAREAVERALDHLSERASSFHRASLEAEALQRADSDVTLPEIRAEIEDLGRRGTIYIAGDWIATRKAVEHEERVIQLWRESVGTLEPIAPAMDVPGLTLEQGRAVNEILGSRDQFVGLVGRAGAGKSTALAPIVAGAREAGLAVYVMAPTHKAVGVLRDAGLEADTVARHLADRERPSGPALWVVDEAGMLSTGNMLAIMESARAEGARVVFVGDPRQLKAVEAGAPFEHLLREGMAAATLTTIRRQRDEQLRGAAQAAASGDGRRALEILEGRGAVVERETLDERLAAAVDAYQRLVVDGRSALLITPRNEDRESLNEAVRERRIARGEVHPGGYRGQVLVPRELTREQRGDASNYRVGEVVRYTHSAPRCGVQARDQGEVLAIHGDEIEVRLQGDRVVRYDPAQARRCAVYDVAERTWAGGDRIEIRTNIDRERGLTNGTTGTILSIDGEGVARVQIDAGGARRARETSLDLSRLEAIEYGYASTVYKAQGRTVDGVVWSVRAEDAEMRGGYVAITRARDQAVIVTDDIERLRETVGRLREEMPAREVAARARKERERGAAERDRDAARRPRGTGEGARGGERAPRSASEEMGEALGALERGIERWRGEVEATARSAERADRGIAGALRMIRESAAQVPAWAKELLRQAGGGADRAAAWLRESLERLAVVARPDMRAQVHEALGHDAGPGARGMDAVARWARVAERLALESFRRSGPLGAALDLGETHRTQLREVEFRERVQEREMETVWLERAEAEHALPQMFAGEKIEPFLPREARDLLERRSVEMIEAVRDQAAEAGRTGEAEALDATLDVLKRERRRPEHDDKDHER